MQPQDVARSSFEHARPRADMCGLHARATCMSSKMESINRPISMSIIIS